MSVISYGFLGVIMLSGFWFNIGWIMRSPRPAEQKALWTIALFVIWAMVWVVGIFAIAPFIGSGI